jgi:hypothetical protein
MVIEHSDTAGKFPQALGWVDVVEMVENALSEFLTCANIFHYQT